MQIEELVDCAALSGYARLFPTERPPFENSLASITDNQQIAVVRFFQRQLRTQKPGLGEILSFVDQDSIETVRVSFPALQSGKKPLAIVILILLFVEADVMTRPPRYES